MMAFNWKQRLTTGWGLMRLFRLGLAVLVFVESWKNSDVLFALLGGVLLFQAVFDVGCCGSAGCDVAPKKAIDGSDASAGKEVTFEEIK